MIFFVYNADSGKLNAAFDTAHKLLSPSTYDCQLCQMTYGLLSEKQAWKEFREQAADELIFLHRDEYEKQFEKKVQYPVVLKQVEDDLEVILPREELEKMTDVSQLITRLNTELKRG